MAPWSIGIDFGHGETSVAALNLAQLQVQTDVAVLELDNQKTQVTAIGRNAAGDVLIGQAALTTDDAHQTRIGFKADPSTASADALALMRLYFRTLCAQIKQQHGLVGDPQTQVYVGIPSAWQDAPTQAAYRDLLANDIAPAVRMVPESRAALLHARETGLVTSEELASTSVVIDLGSLTTDITLMTGLVETPEEYGAELGASLIEKALLDRLVAAHADAQALAAAFAVEPAHLSRCELACRRAKEEYFRNPTRTRPILGGEVITADLDFTFRLTAADMEDVLHRPLRESLRFLPWGSEVGRVLATIGHLSWPEAFTVMVDDLVDALRAQRRQVDFVLLTGGAARMDFVQRICRARFGEQTVRVDTEPEFAISRGLARYGALGPRVKAFHAAVDAFIAGELPALVNREVPALIDDLAPALADQLPAAVLTPIYERLKMGEMQTVNQFDQALRKQLENWLEDDATKALLADAALPWVRQTTQAVNQRTSVICRQYGMRSDRLEIAVRPPTDKLGRLVPPFDLGPLIWSIGGLAVVALGMLVVLSPAVTLPYMLICVVFPFLAEPAEQLLRDAPILGVGRFMLPGSQRMADNWAGQKDEFVARIRSYLSDPAVFLAAQEERGAGKRMARLWARLWPADRAGKPPPVAAPPVDFADQVVTTVVESFGRALHARAQEAERFIA